ncbi:MAG: phosphoribosylformylglycinamidine synthase subunit PurQ [Peptococcia bacterium]|jgi:phosphoribosylformylglycinamidine synthase I
MKFGIVVFPGSHGETDCHYVIEQVLKEPVTYLWHAEEDLQGVDCVIVPGGYAYGNYLRPGSIARFSPLMKQVIAFGKKGGLILGICNGFQILTEAGLLPGALIRNPSLRFQCQNTFLRVEQTQTPFTNLCEQKEVVRIPIAHAEGSFVTDKETLERLEKEGRVVFRYCDEQGAITPESNPNGSLNNIAGIINEQGNILGMMPRPERCVEALLGGEAGKKIFSSLVEWWQGGVGR